MEKELIEIESQVEGKFITFQCNDRQYAIPVEQVSEIVALPEVTAVPDMPAYVRGVINLRGRVIPVMDVRLRFEMPFQPYTARTCVVIVTAAEADVGLIVDEVKDVIQLTGEQIQPAPSIGDGSSRYVMGTGVTGDTVRLLLKVEALLDNHTNPGTNLVPEKLVSIPDNENPGK